MTTILDYAPGLAYDGALLERIGRLEVVLRNLETEILEISDELVIYDDTTFGPAKALVSRNRHTIAHNAAVELRMSLIRNNTVLLPLLAAAKTLITRC